jgi:hypothetical protein
MTPICVDKLDEFSEGIQKIIRELFLFLGRGGPTPQVWGRLLGTSMPSLLLALDSFTG